MEILKILMQISEIISMNKYRRIILEHLYSINKTSSKGRDITEISENTGIDKKIVERETTYISQKGYITKDMVRTDSFSGYFCRIIAPGIDFVESIFFKYRSILIVLLVVLFVFVLYKMIT